MCCCFLPSCCCGWQTLEHGLFIFALLDILFNLFMVGMNVAAYSTVFAGLNVALFVADICLAVGAKQAIRLLVLIWLVVFLVQILLSVLVPPVMLLTVYLVQMLVGSEGGHRHDWVLVHLLNLDFDRESHVRFYLNHLIRFVVGLVYIYIWIMARSLYMVMGRIGYTGKTDESVFIHGKGGRMSDEWVDEMVSVEGGPRPDSTSRSRKIVYNGDVFPSEDGVAYFPHYNQDHADKETVIE